jgi:cardiolipin synthase
MPVVLSILFAFSVLFSVAVIIQILLGGRNTDEKLFWIAVIIVFPFFGVVAYCLAGIDYRTEADMERLHGKARALLEKEITPEQKEAWFSDKDMDLVPERLKPLARLLRSSGEGNKVYANNSFEIITIGARKRELLLEDIKNAKHYIHIEYFRFGNDESGREVRDLLYEKVAQGVEVRFLNNNMIGRVSPRSYFRDMQKHGMEVVPYTHIRMGFRQWLMRINSQNHRKLVIIDGKVAFTGGMNLNDNYFRRWRDTHLRISGPVIARLQASFIDSWIGSGGTFKQPLGAYFNSEYPQEPAPYKDKLLQVAVSAPEYPWPTTQLAYEWILSNATDYVYIQTPYFVPPDAFLGALKSSAMRGVDVRIMLPKKVDTPFIGPVNRSYYAECLQAGVRIYERDGAFIHSKTLVSDDDLAIVGASNLDFRSFQINSEMDTFIYDKEAALASKEIFLQDIALSEELHLESFVQSRRWYYHLGSDFLRLFRSLL